MTPIRPYASAVPAQTSPGSPGKRADAVDIYQGSSRPAASRQVLGRLLETRCDVPDLQDIEAVLGTELAQRAIVWFCSATLGYRLQTPTGKRAAAALLLASLRAGDRAVTKALLDYGTPVSGGSSSADNPLDVALASGAWADAQELVRRGADLQRFGAGVARLAASQDPELSAFLLERLLWAVPKANVELWKVAHQLLQPRAFAHWLGQATRLLVPNTSQISERF